MKRGKVKLVGIEKVMRNLQREIKNIEGLSMKGLIRAAIIIRRDMDKTSPLIPLDKGNLRASFYTVTGRNFLSDIAESKNPNFRGKGKAEMSTNHAKDLSGAKSIAGDKLIVVMGFSAVYAMWVHEMMGNSNGTWSRPGSGPKFFEYSINRNAAKVLQEIRKSATIKN